MSTAYPFDLYAALDWSGAAGPNCSGIALAVCGPTDAVPKLVKPPGGKPRWARLDILQWLNRMFSRRRVLLGMDVAFSFPFLDLDAYFPGMDTAPETALHLWELVETIAAKDDDLAAISFVKDDRLAPHFFTAKPAHSRYKRRFRRCEHLCLEHKLGAAQSVFHLIGPNQVGKASLSAMRLLRRLKDVSIWPFDAISESRSLAVEIYTAFFIKNAGFGQKKIRSVSELNAALRFYGCRGAVPAGAHDVECPLNDHETDVLISAAGLRRLASDPAFWCPRGLDEQVRHTEGWVFGVR